MLDVTDAHSAAAPFTNVSPNVLGHVTVPACCPAGATPESLYSTLHGCSTVILTAVRAFVAVAKERWMDFILKIIPIMGPALPSEIITRIGSHPDQNTPKNSD